MVPVATTVTVSGALVGSENAVGDDLNRGAHGCLGSERFLRDRRLDVFLGQLAAADQHARVEVAQREVPVGGDHEQAGQQLAFVEAADPDLVFAGGGFLDGEFRISRFSLASSAQT